ncbi:MAG: hypothetical protein QW478_10580 [Candidatus Micrarchaeaceae archaeon]
MSILDVIFLIVFFIELEILIGSIIIRGLVSRKEEIIHDLIVNEIYNIINDKQIFDDIKKYISELGSQSISQIMPKSKPMRIQDIIGLGLQYFLGQKMNPEKPPEKEKPILRNPFQKT